MKFILGFFLFLNCCIQAPCFADENTYVPAFVSYNDLTSTAITVAAYVQLIASTTVSCSKISVYNSSAKAIFLALGASGSEVKIQYDFPPTQSRELVLRIPAGLRLSARAEGADATTGFFIVDCLR